VVVQSDMQLTIYNILIRTILALAVRVLLLLHQVYLSIAEATLCLDKGDNFEFSQIDLQKFVARFQYLIFRTPRPAFAFSSDPSQITKHSAAAPMFIRASNII